MTFKQELHRAMSIYRVRAYDLLWLMGYGNWGYWDPNLGWFLGDKAPPYPDKAEQVRILALIAGAQDNPEYWRIRYAEIKDTAEVINKGLKNAKYYQDKYSLLYHELHRKQLSTKLDNIRWKSKMRLKSLRNLWIKIKSVLFPNGEYNTNKAKIAARGLFTAKPKDFMEAYEKAKSENKNNQT
jgi:hypothetical protein